ncbi:MAG: lysoplasmalogenase [Pseudomonadales bacterium]
MLPVTSCLAALGVLLYAEFREYVVLKAAAKLIASSAFIWAALYWGATASTYGSLVLLGLVFCWLGDMLLLPEGSGKSFLAGLFAFLCGHIVYAAAFSTLALNERAGLVALLAVIPVGAFVLRWLWPTLPAPMRIAVPLYVFVILSMVALAWSVTVSGAPLVLALGATGFAMSDLSVARERFIAPGFGNRAWGLPLYFISQLLLAYSVAVI